MLLLLLARLVDDCVASVALSVARRRAALIQRSLLLARLRQLLDAYEDVKARGGRRSIIPGRPPVLALRPAVRHIETRVSAPA